MDQGAGYCERSVGGGGVGVITAIAIMVAIIVILGGGYFAACAGAQRWLTFREWWG